LFLVRCPKALSCARGQRIRNILPGCLFVHCFNFNIRATSLKLIITSPIILIYKNNSAEKPSRDKPQELFLKRSYLPKWSYMAFSQISSEICAATEKLLLSSGRNRVSDRHQIYPKTQNENGRAH
jgi:hypothetical protein